MRLATRRYLVGDEQTLADWRLFTTLLRFDPVYVGHFKCNLRRIADYPNLSGYLRDLYQTPGCRADRRPRPDQAPLLPDARRASTPRGIVPAGPVIDLGASHGRAALAR